MNCFKNNFTEGIGGYLLFEYNKIKNKRKRNFEILHSALGATNELRITQIPPGPLCYLYMTNKAEKIIELLQAPQVYVPMYWKDALNKLDEKGRQAYYVKNILPLPIDQRYGETEIEYISLLIRSVKN